MTQPTYKLIAIDVDGTLLDTDHQISQGAAEALASASAQGVLPVLASGRSYLLLEEYFQVLHVAPYYIGSGGAMVADIDGKIIDKSPVSREAAVTIAFIVRGDNLGICFHESSRQNCEMFDPELREHMRSIARSNIDFVEDILVSTDTPPEKITIFGERDVLERTKAHLSGLPLDIGMTFSGPKYLEVTHKGVNKGSALKRLMKFLEIPKRNVAAIGDQQNDISMFQAAGLSVAMGNAPDEVKAAADLIAPTNDEGGLAWMLREIILKHEAYSS